VIEQFHEAIHEVEQNWAGKRLLVVGDVMLDKYIWGEVGRISPEAPVPVVRSTHQSEQPGGAANVAMNLAHLSAQATVVGFTGGDAACQRLARQRHFPGLHRLRRLSYHHQVADSGRTPADAAPRQRTAWASPRS